MCSFWPSPGVPLIASPEVAVKMVNEHAAENLVIQTLQLVSASRTVRSNLSLVSVLRRKCSIDAIICRRTLRWSMWTDGAVPMFCQLHQRRCFDYGKKLNGPVPRLSSSLAGEFFIFFVVSTLVYRIITSSVTPVLVNEES